MQDWIYLLIAFILGFFVKHLLGTVCRSRLIEGSSLVAEVADAPVDEVLAPNVERDVETGSVCTNHADCKSGYCGGPTCLESHNFGNGRTTCLKVGYKCKVNPWV
tara:strand:- start:143 stop:457 length:315 start_codon:yes stop_codon:yes gene_type:complete